MSRARLLAVLLVAIVALAVVPIPHALAVNQQNLTISGATWVTGGLDFNGTNQYAYCNDHANLDYTSALSIAISFKPESLPASGSVSILLIKDEVGACNYRVGIRTVGSTGYLQFAIYDGGWTTWRATTTTITAESTKFAIITYTSEDETPVITINNVSQSITKDDNNGETLIANAGQLRLGLDAGNGQDYDGEIYGVSMYASILTPTQKAQLYAFNPDYAITPAVAHHAWALNEASGTTAYDGTAFYDVETFNLDLVVKNISWNAVETFAIGVDVLDAFAWAIAETFIAVITVASWFPSIIADTNVYLFIGSVIGFTVSLAITLAKLKTRDGNGAYFWIMITVLLGCLMLGVLLA